MVKPQADLKKVLSRLSTVNLGGFGKFGLSSPCGKVVAPLDVLFESRSGADGSQLLIMGLKYYELFPEGSGLNPGAIEESVEELVDRNNQEPFGNFGWVVAYDSTRMNLDSSNPTRVLRVNVWSHTNPDGFTSKVFEYYKGKRKSMIIPDPQTAREINGKEFSIGTY